MIHLWREGALQVTTHYFLTGLVLVLLFLSPDLVLWKCSGWREAALLGSSVTTIGTSMIFSFSQYKYFILY